MTNRMDLSIGQRLTIGFALLLAVVAGLVGTMYYWNARSAEAERAFIGRIAPLTSAAEELERAMLDVAVAMRSFLLAPDAERLQRHEDDLSRTRDALAKLGALPKEPDGAALYGSFAPLVQRYLAEANRLVQLRQAEGQGVNKSDMALVAVRRAAVNGLHAFSDLQQSKKTQALAAIEGARTGTARALAVAGLLALLLIFATGLLTARSIQRPARELVGVADALQSGDWQPALAWAPRAGGTAVARDEMTQLGRAFGAAAVALEARELRLRADRAIAGATASSLAREEIAAAGLNAACDHLGAEVGALYVWDESAGRLAPAALRALNGTTHPVALGEGIPGRAARELRTVVAHDIPPDSPFSVRLGYDASPPRAVAAVPIAFRGSLLGVLLVASLRDLDEQSVVFLEDAAVQLGIGLQNVKTYERVQQLLAEVSEQNQKIQAQNEELQAQNEELQAQGEEIQAQNEELQAQGEEIQAQNDQLKQQADSLRDHAGALAEADRRKNEFLGVLAHELRNPMAAIGNSLYAITRGKVDAETRARAQEIIHRQTRYLTRLVDDLLDITRISSGKIQLQKEPVDLIKVVRECVEDYRDAARNSGVGMEIRLPQGAIPIDGDRTRLGQVIGNLLDNAIKFANGRREVIVELRARDSRAELRVRDHGVGMDRGMIERLFQPFSQADSTLARGRSGLGLGLALAKSLVSLHGGEIRAHSDGLGHGAEFTIRLPLLAGAALKERDAPAPASARAGARRRVLIVEDNLDAAESLRAALGLLGHEVQVAHKGAEGVDLAHAFQPDVLLCDIGLQGMNGYEVARRMRADERLKALFLVALSGYAGPEDQERARQAGFDLHVRKPADVEALHQLISDAPRRGA